jgi:hypothetical protein
MASIRAYVMAVSAQKVWLHLQKSETIQKNPEIFPEVLTCKNPKNPKKSETSK